MNDRVCNVFLSFESGKKPRRYYHSNESPLAVLSNGTICFSAFYRKTENFFFGLLLGAKGFDKMSSVIYVIGRFKILVLPKMIFLF